MNFRFGIPACQIVTGLGRLRDMSAPGNLTDKIDQSVRQLGLGRPVAVRVSSRARRMSLRVDAGARGVELVLPRRFCAQTAIAFIARHRGWIAARVAAMPPPLHLADGVV